MGTSLKQSELNDLKRIANEQHSKGTKLAFKAMYCWKRSGNALIKIKDSLPHGQFESWVEKNFDSSIKTAQTYMNVARNWNFGLKMAVQDGEVLSLRDATTFLLEHRDEDPKTIKLPKGRARSVLNALESVSPGLAPGHVIVEQTDHFIFADGKLNTWNDEVACQIDSPLDSTLDITGAVHGPRLLSVLKQLAHESPKFDVDQDRNELTVRAKKGKKRAAFKINPIVPHDRGFKVPGDKAKWTALPEADQFFDAVKIARLCASNDYAKPHQICLHICPDYIESFDNLRNVACRYDVSTGLDKPILVRHRSFVGMAKCPAGEFALDDEWFHLRHKSRGYLFSMRREDPDAEDPDDQIPDDENPKKPVRFPLPDKLFAQDAEILKLPKKKLVRAAVKTAMIFAKQNSDDPDQIALKLEGQKLRITGEDSSGRYSESLTVEYNGPPIRALVDNNLFLEMAKRTQNFRISDKMLLADGDTFKLILSLHTPKKRSSKQKLPCKLPLE